MAATAIALHLRPTHRSTIRNPSFIHFFSSSTSDPNNVEDPNIPSSSPPPPQPQSSFSSYFSDVKASLKQPQQQHQQQPPPRRPFPLSSTAPPSAGAPSKIASIEEIRKNLSEFRRLSAAPPPGDRSSPPPLPPSSSQHISFQELYKRNVIPKGGGGDSANDAGKGRPSLEAIRESLRQLQSNAAAKGQANSNDDPMSLSKFKESLKLRPVDPSKAVFGGTDKLPQSVFGKEMREKKHRESPAMKTEFVKMYSYEELGKKLRILRPEAKGGDWFSLKELNERLMKLREMEEKENDSRIGGVWFSDLRQSLVKLQISDDEKNKNKTFQRLDILSQLGRTPNFMLAPPKEHLVEKYFHPDNMSSSEKMKLELQKVRDYFKMSESDCGSTRLQVAQLTTKIKHLTSCLHKKVRVDGAKSGPLTVPTGKQKKKKKKESSPTPDKHSWKGLIGMIQRRKKLLKYLRRTDWDSYTLVLSKFTEIRDPPEYKPKDYIAERLKKGNKKKIKVTKNKKNKNKKQKMPA